MQWLSLDNRLEDKHFRSLFLIIEQKVKEYRFADSVKSMKSSSNKWFIQISYSIGNMEEPIELTRKRGRAAVLCSSWAYPKAMEANQRVKLVWWGSIKGATWIKTEIFALWYQQKLSKTWMGGAESIILLLALMEK